MVEALQQSACRFSRVSMEEAFAIDEVRPCLYERLGHGALVALSTAFYDAVYDDELAWFRQIFAGSDKAAAIRNQYEFLVQRLGGPSLFTQRKGHPALIGRHAGFELSHRAARRWLEHMAAALAATAGDAEGSIDEDSRQRLLAFFKHTAYFLVAGVGRAKQRRREQQQQQPPPPGAGRVPWAGFAITAAHAAAAGLSGWAVGFQLGEYRFFRQVAGLARWELAHVSGAVAALTYLGSVAMLRCLETGGTGNSRALALATVGTLLLACLPAIHIMQ